MWELEEGPGRGRSRPDQGGENNTLIYQQRHVITGNRRSAAGDNVYQTMVWDKAGQICYVCMSI